MRRSKNILSQFKSNKKGQMVLIMEIVIAIAVGSVALYFILNMLPVYVTLSLEVIDPATDLPKESLINVDPATGAGSDLVIQVGGDVRGFLVRNRQKVFFDIAVQISGPGNVEKEYRSGSDGRVTIPKSVIDVMGADITPGSYGQIEFLLDKGKWKNVNYEISRGTITINRESS